MTPPSAKKQWAIILAIYGAASALMLGVGSYLIGRLISG